VAAVNALATERPFDSDQGSQGPPSTTPRSSSRAKAAADLAQLVAELGDELVRYHADRRLRLDRTPVPPSTALHLVATIPPSRPSPARPLVEGRPEIGATLRAATTVTVSR
jgi:hypothetical protein